MITSSLIRSCSTDSKGRFIGVLCGVQEYHNHIEVSTLLSHVLKNDALYWFITLVNTQLLSYYFDPGVDRDEGPPMLPTTPTRLKPMKQLQTKDMAEG